MQYSTVAKEQIAYMYTLMMYTNKNSYVPNDTRFCHNNMVHHN